MVWILKQMLGFSSFSPTQLGFKVPEGEERPTPRMSKRNLATRAGEGRETERGFGVRPTNEGAEA